jgi:hypothetical protein
MSSTTQKSTKESKVTQKMNQDYKSAIEYITNRNLNVTNEVRKLVLDAADQDTINSINNSIEDSESVSYDVAKLLLPKLVTNIKILQQATLLLATQADKLDRDILILRGEKNMYKSYLEDYKRIESIDHSIRTLREEKEKLLLRHNNYFNREKDITHL